MKRIRPLLLTALLSVMLCMLPGVGLAAAQLESESLDMVSQACQDQQKDNNNIQLLFRDIESEVSPVRYNGNRVGQRYFYALPNNDSVRFDVLQPAGQPVRFVLELRREDRPSLFIGMDKDCIVREARRIVYQNGQAIKLELLDKGLNRLSDELLNPEPVGSDFAVVDSAVAVAMVDSGVNYLLPEINRRLARDSTGRMLGYDFWEMDARPFDVHSAGSPFFVQRHGTRTASLMLSEAGEVRLVSYRYPRPDMQRMSQLVEHADSLGVRIIGLPLGSNREEDWLTFLEAAKARPHILFIVSAGNNGRDIDAKPVYPASMDLENMVVVTSADDFVRPAERTNWGKKSVDYLLPAERQKVIKFSGEQGLASGSSYAVSRMVALAAKLLSISPDMDTAQLQAAIKARSITPVETTWVRIGYIPDPLKEEGTPKFDLVASEMMNQNKSVQYSLSLNLLQLDSRWQKELVLEAVEGANKILEQCQLSIDAVNFYSMNARDYLQDLETGSAYTILQEFRALLPESRGVEILFARESRMEVVFEAEAFGPGNTATRPWLQDSVWIAYGSRDLPVTIAHELFHVLSNTGGHAPSPQNLMSAESSLENTELTPAQCSLAKTYFTRGDSDSSE
ncbi:MAG: S8/S53 family peptidase [Arenicellales bacterium]